MKKKMTGLLFLSLLTLVLAACTADDTDTDNDTSDSQYDSSDADLSGLDVETEEETDITILAVYYPDEYGETILSEIITYDQNTKLSEEEVLEVLAEYDVISDEITFESSHESTTENNTYILTLDLSAALTGYLDDLEPEIEPLTVQCIANTFIDYYHMDELILTAGGESLVTGRGDYTEAISYSDVNIDQITQKDQDEQD